MTPCCHRILSRLFHLLPEAIPKLTLSLTSSPGFAHRSLPTHPPSQVLLPPAPPWKVSSSTQPHTLCIYHPGPNISSSLCLGIPYIFLEYQTFFFTFYFFSLSHPLRFSFSSSSPGPFKQSWSFLPPVNAASTLAFLTLY